MAARVWGCMTASKRVNASVKRARASAVPAEAGRRQKASMSARCRASTRGRRTAAAGIRTAATG